MKLEHIWSKTQNLLENYIVLLTQRDINFDIMWGKVHYPKLNLCKVCDKLHVCFSLWCFCLMIKVNSSTLVSLWKRWISVGVDIFVTLLITQQAWAGMTFSQLGLGMGNGPAFSQFLGLGMGILNIIPKFWDWEWEWKIKFQLLGLGMGMKT